MLSQQPKQLNTYPVLKTIHTACGVTLGKIKEEIGWDVKVADDLSDTELPSNEELNMYHEKIVTERKIIFRRPDK